MGPTRLFTELAMPKDEDEDEEETGCSLTFGAETCAADIEDIA